MPDPTQLIDYNRYLYARGNPLKYNDPSGHETSKPDWWPPFIPWAFDLPDAQTGSAILEWVSENNIPTAAGGQIGIDSGGGFGIGGAGSVEAQYTFNILSGELLYAWNTFGGLRAGTPQGAISIHGGGTYVIGASSADAILDASLTTAVDASTPLTKVGTTAAWFRAYNSTDVNGNGQFDMVGRDGISEPLENPFIDEKLNRTVDSVSLNVALGVNLMPTTPIEAGISHGVADTNGILKVNVYQFVGDQVEQFARVFLP